MPFKSNVNIFCVVILDVRNPKRRDSTMFLKVDKIMGTPNEEHLFIWKLMCTPDYFVLVSNDSAVLAISKSLQSTSAALSNKMTSF